MQYCKVVLDVITNKIKCSNFYPLNSLNSPSYFIILYYIDMLKQLICLIVMVHTLMCLFRYGWHIGIFAFVNTPLGNCVIVHFAIYAPQSTCLSFLLLLAALTLHRWTWSTPLQTLRSGRTCGTMLRRLSKRMSFSICLYV